MYRQNCSSSRCSKSSGAVKKFRRWAFCPILDGIHWAPIARFISPLAREGKPTKKVHSTPHDSTAKSPTFARPPAQIRRWTRPPPSHLPLPTLFHPLAPPPPPSGHRHMCQTLAPAAMPGAILLHPPHAVAPEPAQKCRHRVGRKLRPSARWPRRVPTSRHQKRGRCLRLGACITLCCPRQQTFILHRRR
jgi:hypothetical protein